MSAIGRNERCRCGSGKKVKRCCGVRHGPSEAELAKAFLATTSREAVHRLARLSSDEFHELFEAMVDLPGRHLALQVPLPRLFTPELDALRSVVEHNDDASDELVDAAVACVDTPEHRAALARAVLDLAHSDVIDEAVADVAIVDLDLRRESAFMRMRMSVLAAMSVLAGAIRTPSGLLVAAR